MVRSFLLSFDNDFYSRAQPDLLRAQDLQEHFASAPRERLGGLLNVLV
jgi:hypothetical protein